VLQLLPPARHQPGHSTVIDSELTQVKQPGLHMYDTRISHQVALLFLNTASDIAHVHLFMSWLAAPKSGNRY